jgi:hypothetical protein
VAEAAGLTQTRIRQMILSGELKAVKRGATWLVSAYEAEKLLRARGKQP